jgi:D-alanine transaminase
MGSIGLVDGRIIDLNEKIIEMEDRGYQFGDGVYEVTRVYNGRPFALRPHVDRLYHSLRELKIPGVYTYDELAAFHEQLIKESGLASAAIYLQITRGVAPRTHGFPETTIPRLTMSIRPVKTNTELRASGAKGIYVPDERWLRCDIKSINLLGNILAKQASKEAGAFEAVQVRGRIITEGSSSNFFLVKDGVLWTHPVNNLILRGITRTLVIDKLAPQLGLPVIEKEFDRSFAFKADELFLTGTTTEIMPLVQMDRDRVGDGKPGPITRKLIEAYDELIVRECGAK